MRIWECHVCKETIPDGAYLCSVCQNIICYNCVKYNIEKTICSKCEEER